MQLGNAYGVVKIDSRFGETVGDIAVSDDIRVSHVGCIPDVVSDQLDYVRVSAGRLGGDAKLLVVDFHAGASEGSAERVLHVVDRYVGQHIGFRSAEECDDLIVEQIGDHLGESGECDGDVAALSNLMLDRRGQRDHIGALRGLRLVYGDQQSGVMFGECVETCGHGLTHGFRHAFGGQLRFAQAYACAGEAYGRLDGEPVEHMVLASQFVDKTFAQAFRSGFFDDVPFSGSGFVSEYGEHNRWLC